jgi:hypothetical protein
MRADNPLVLGAIVGLGGLLVLLIGVILYRLLALLVTEPVAQLVIGLAVALGVLAALVEWVTSRPPKPPAAS